MVSFHLPSLILKVFLKSNPFEINFELLEEIYWNTGQDLVSCIDDVRELLLSFKETKKSVVAEFGQAYWLDKRHGFTPNVTASHTSGAEFFHSGGIPHFKNITGRVLQSLRYESGHASFHHSIGSN